VPLVLLGSEEDVLSERQLAERKIEPQWAEGPLVKVARASGEAEADFICSLLLEVGIPSMAQRSPGADVPEFLAGGARDVMVPESGAQAAREALAWQHGDGADAAQETR
jgi:hypothetical protein